MSDIAIRVDNLSKMYRIGTRGEQPRGLAQAARTLVASPFGYLQRMRRPPTEAETLWALRDVSFEVKHGEVLGIIGRNGAGKSTLLKILSRITEPSSGQAQVFGRVGSLLEVGTGFHPELTGRENMYLNGAILGMKRSEIDRKFDEIVDFAGVERFLDTPVKRYSSGMYVRLAFAVAAHLEPEILIIDEVLAVGDAEFQKKCLGKMGEVAGAGRTILFVSHNMQAVLRLCSRSVWLQNGIVAEVGLSEVIIGAYLSARTQSGSGSYQFRDYGDHAVIFSELEMRNCAGALASSFRADEPIQFRVIYQVLQPVSGMTLGLNITDGLGGSLWAAGELDRHPELFDRIREPGEYELTITAPGNVLRPGTYQVALGAASGSQYHHHPQDFPAFEITTDGYWRESHRFFGLGGGPVAVPMDIKAPVRINGHQ